MVSSGPIYAPQGVAGYSNTHEEGQANATLLSWKMDASQIH